MQKPLSTILIAFLLFACGDDDDDDVTPDAAAGTIDAAPGTPDAVVAELTVTSTAFNEGGAIPVAHACDGANVSPALTWSGGPSADSYAVVFTDLDNGLIHSIIWDIPGTVTSLPEGVENVAEPPVPAVSKQARAYDDSTRGSLGPCPPVGTHTYEFKLYALDVAPLPDVTLDSSRGQLEPVIIASSIASATLTGTHMRP